MPPNIKQQTAMYDYMKLRAQKRLDISQTACFVGCTLVRMADGTLWKRIDDMEVGDMVLAMPEDGIGEAVPKRVTKTFKFEDKAVWYIGVARHDKGMGYTAEGFAVTAEHPFCVYGYAPKVTEVGKHNPIEFYDTPQWKRVDELLQGDVLYSGAKDRYYLVNSVKPFAKSFLPKYAWLQGGESMYDWQFEEVGTDWDLLSEEKGILGANILQLGDDMDENDANIIVDDTVPPYPKYHLDGYTGNRVHGTQYAPYTTTVYNIEVEDYHTYCIGGSGILVHDTDCGKTVKDMLLE
ncbi:hypothetical protein [Psychrobacter sp. I-STPA10]|uniref:hypothetical protein n=1 Tax=Psychrobacter sp. I-STPA10 TaxID=2585769 RepID=UPI001E3DA70E|nr:hypothetical protein [Psychrobacter sp. I-STPA10]